MNELLFKSVTQRQEPSTEGETTFQFLERGGRKEAIAIRQWMEKWFREFPTEHKAELKKRLQLKGFKHFMGAYFELQVFAMLRRLDCTVEVHPHFAETGGTVDFRVTHGRESFFVEATVCGIGRGKLQSNANEEDAVRQIRAAMGRPHSDVWLDAEGKLLTPLAKNRLVVPISELLDAYSAEDVRALNETFPFHTWHWPRCSIEEGGWRLEVSLSPPIASNGEGQVFGPSRGGAVDGSSPIAKALSKKVQDWKKKTQRQEAFLIAINTCHSDYFQGDEQEAIYGRPDPDVNRDVLAKFLSPVAGVIAFGNATLGCEIGAPVQLYGNVDKGVPECLQFLRQETKLGELLGFVDWNQSILL